MRNTNCCWWALNPFPFQADPDCSCSSTRGNGVQRVKHFCYHPQLDVSNKFIPVCLPLTEHLGQVSTCTLLSRKPCQLSKQPWNSLSLDLSFLHCPCGVLFVNCWNSLLKHFTSFSAVFIQEISQSSATLYFEIHTERYYSVLQGL